MVNHDKRAQRYASSTLAVSDLTRVDPALMLEGWARLIGPGPKWRIGRTVRDLAWVAGGWLFFIGVITQPVAQLIGVGVCAIALALLPAERRSNNLADAD